MLPVNAFIAANRFGLGARPGELVKIARNPRAWIADQISAPHRVPREMVGLPSSKQALVKVHEIRIQGPQAVRQMMRRTTRDIMFRELSARILTMIRSEQSFRERMVMFWANHFTVSGTRFTVGPLAGGYERESIRPFVFGHFEDMLLAVAHHPAMLTYLDNARSIGPNSIAGRRQGRGLNENLAREILELHTLGVNGHYTQNDVTEFAKILTGWSHGGVRSQRNIRFLGPINGNFEFRYRTHEPGSKTLLGKIYQEDGEREGINALKALVRHPSTAKFIATKLARHFVADDPPRDAVDRLAKVFRDTEGNLATVSRELIRIEQVWREPLPKVKNPYELIVSTLRAVGTQEISVRAVANSLRQLGQFPYRAPSPAGWPDRAQDWISPESLMRRIEWVRAATARLPRSLTPSEVSEGTIGPVVAPPTKEMIDAAPSAAEALAMIFTSLEFQRR